jgi:uncharacterized protein
VAVEYLKALPPIDSTTLPFWDGTKRHELMVYHCLNCGKSYWPAIHCAACDKPRMEWVKASGQGEVFSFTIIHQAPPNWSVDVPYNVVWIKLKEGPILISRMECQNQDIYIGAPVQVVFEDVTEDVTLTRFRPV